MSSAISSGGAVREIHFLPLYLLPCPFQGSLCSFIFWRTYLKARWEGGHVLPSDSPISCSFTPVNQRHRTISTKFSREKWLQHWNVSLKGEIPSRSDRKCGTLHIFYIFMGSPDTVHLWLQKHLSLLSSPSSFHSPFFLFLSSLIVSSLLGFLGAGRDGLFFVTDLLQH